MRRASSRSTSSRVRMPIGRPPQVDHRDPVDAGLVHGQDGFGQRRVGTGGDRLGGHQLADLVAGQLVLVAVERPGGLDGPVRQDGPEQVAQRHHTHHRRHRASRLEQVPAAATAVMAERPVPGRDRRPTRRRAAERPTGHRPPAPGPSAPICPGPGYDTLETMTRSPRRTAHRSGRAGWLRAAVLGADDGIVSTASLVIGVAASSATQSVVLVAGLAGLVAGAMSMAAGEYVSVSSQRDAERADVDLERRQQAPDPAAELQELTDIYVRRGLDRELATTVATRLTVVD